MEKLRARNIMVASAVLGLLLLAPMILSSSDQRLIARILVLGLLALSLNILVGNTGIVSFGHGLFYGTGAYTVSLLWLHLEISPMLALVIAPCTGALFAAIGGLVAFRAKRLYFGLLTLALSQFGFVLATQWYGLTQGENGIYGVQLPSWLMSTDARYWFILAVFTGATLLMWAIIASPFGTTLRAIRDNRERVAFLGINPIRYEYLAFVLSGAFAGLAGALLILLDQNSFPALFHWTTSAEPLLMIVIGGAHTFFGPVVGAFIVIFVQDFLQGVTGHINLIYGLVVVVIAVAAPRGLIGTGASAVTRIAGWWQTRTEEDPQTQVDDSLQEQASPEHAAAGSVPKNLKTRTTRDRK